MSPNRRKPSSKISRSRAPKRLESGLSMVSSLEATENGDYSESDDENYDLYVKIDKYFDIIKPNIFP